MEIKIATTEELERVEGDLAKLTEFILSHDALSQQMVREGDNVKLFREDYINKALNPFLNSFVAYQKGILCGQSACKEQLFKRAGGYYGTSSLMVVYVPNTFKNLSTAISKAMGNR